MPMSQELLNLNQLVLTNKAGCNGEAIKRLLKANPGLVNTTNSFGYSVLKVLLNQWHVKGCTLEDFKMTALLLVEQGADCRVGDAYNGNSLMHHLVLTNKEACNDKAIYRLVKINPFLVNTTNNFGYSPLKALLNQWYGKGCSLEDFKNTALLLAKLGADCLVNDSYNSTSLVHHLVLTNKEGCNDEAIQHLVKINPSFVNTTDSFGYSPLKALLNQWHVKGCSLEDFKKTALLLAELGSDCQVGDAYNGTSLVHHLVLTNKEGCNDEAIKRLVKINPSLVNTKNSFGYSPLKALLNQWHVKGCSLEDFKKTALLLAEQGADCQVGDAYNGNSLAHHLVLTNKKGCNDEAIKRVVKVNPSFVNTTNSFGYSPLKALLNQWHSKGCSFEDFKKTALLLAEQGADCRVGDAYSGNSLVHHLVLTNKEGCNDEAIKHLLKTTPGLVSTMNSFGYSVLKVLLNQWHVKGCTLEDFKKTALLLAEQGADCRVGDSQNGHTLVHHLVLLNNKSEHNSEIEKLISLNKELLNQRNSYGNTPLQAFIRETPNASVEQVKFLIAQGASLTGLDSLGRGLLHLASIHGNQLLAEYLVAQGLKLDDLSRSGETVLHVSHDHKNEQYWNWLLSNDIDLDAQNNYGQTALHYAVSSGNKVMVDWLIKNKASLSIANEQGETPLQRANRLASYTEISASLLAAGAVLRDNSPKQQLFASLKTMKNYGWSLGFESKGKIVSALAEQLEKKTKELFKGKLTAEKLEAFKKDIIPLLHSQDQAMSEYRTSWSRIIANVLIALTGLGTLLIAAHMAYTKATTGRALMFFQPPKTNSERLVDEVDQSLMSISV